MVVLSHTPLPLLLWAWEILARTTKRSSHCILGKRSMSGLHNSLSGSQTYSTVLNANTEDNGRHSL